MIPQENIHQESNGPSDRTLTSKDQSNVTLTKPIASSSTEPTSTPVASSSTACTSTNATADFAPMLLPVPSAKSHVDDLLLTPTGPPSPIQLSADRHARHSRSIDINSKNDSKQSSKNKSGSKNNNTNSSKRTKSSEEQKQRVEKFIQNLTQHALRSFSNALTEDGVLESSEAVANAKAAAAEVTKQHLASAAVTLHEILNATAASRGGSPPATSDSSQDLVGCALDSSSASEKKASGNNGSTKGVDNNIVRKVPHVHHVPWAGLGGSYDGGGSLSSRGQLNSDKSCSLLNMVIGPAQSFNASANPSDEPITNPSVESIAHLGDVDFPSPPAQANDLFSKSLQDIRNSLDSLPKDSLESLQDVLDHVSNDHSEIKNLRRVMLGHVDSANLSKGLKSHLKLQLSQLEFNGASKNNERASRSKTPKAVVSNLQGSISQPDLLATKSDEVAATETEVRKSNGDGSVASIASVDSQAEIWEGHYGSWKEQMTRENPGLTSQAQAIKNEDDMVRRTSARRRLSAISSWPETNEEEKERVRIQQITEADQQNSSKIGSPIGPQIVSSKENTSSKHGTDKDRNKNSMDRSRSRSGSKDSKTKKQEVQLGRPGVPKVLMEKMKTARGPLSDGQKWSPLTSDDRMHAVENLPAGDRLDDGRLSDQG